MKSLYQYIMESMDQESGSYIFTAEDSWQALVQFRFDSSKNGWNDWAKQKFPKKKIRLIPGTKPVTYGYLMPQALIIAIYNLWEEEFGNDLGEVPFRFNSRGDVKLARSYEGYLDDIIREVSDKVKNVKIYHERKGEGNLCIQDNRKTLKITCGNGSIKKDGHAKKHQGDIREKESHDQMVKTIQGLIRLHDNDGKYNPKHVSKSEFESISRFAPIKALWPMYDAGVFDYAVQQVIENGSDPTEFVFGKGEHGIPNNTHRNTKNQIWDNLFNITPTNMKEVLEESGKIIGDRYVITGADSKKDFVNVSIKMRTSQLSGANYRFATTGNPKFLKCMDDDIPYFEVKNEDYMKPFNNICEALCIPAEWLYDNLQHPQKKKISTIPISGRTGGRLGIIVQKLLGGNYWYVKPDLVTFVDAVDHKLKFIVDKIELAEPDKDHYKTVYVDGNINGTLHARLVWRTSKEDDKYPNRIFVEVNVPALIQLISK